MALTVPNASQYSSTDYRPAEVDQLDFQTLGDGTRGVVAGCTMAISGGSAVLTSTKNIVYISGALRYLPSSYTLTLLAGSSLDRFDLVVFDVSDNRIKIVEGTGATSPTFPTLADDQVLLYSLFVPNGSDPAATEPTFFVDKRNVLQPSFQGSVDDNAVFIANGRAANDVPYLVQGNGTTTWTDVSLYRDAARSLTVNGGFKVGQGLAVQGDTTMAGKLAAGGILSAANLLVGFGVPDDGIGERGFWYQQLDGDGAMWVKGVNHWGKLTADVGDGSGNTGLPPGSIITSMLPPGHSYLQGFLALDGSTYNGADAQLGRLWTLAQANVKPFSDWLVNANTALRLPNGNDRALLQIAGQIAGSAAGTMQKVLTIENLPAHKHFGGSGQTGPSGTHSHAPSMGAAGDHAHQVGGGAHQHQVSDPGHLHTGSQWFNSGIIAAVWGGTNKLDGPINDASHTISVDNVGGTWPAQTGVQVTSSGSEHSHAMEATGAHAHSLSLAAAPDHVHSMPPESSVGSGAPVDLTPAHLTVKYYIKT